MTDTAAAQTGELPNLDLLRAVAVLLVLADHVLETIGEQRGLSFHPYDWYMGRLGVLIFFVHTSFVLMWSMKRLQLDGWLLLKSFYIRRAFRIYPLSVFCVIGVVLIGIPGLPWKTYSEPTTASLVSNLLLTMNLTGSQAVLGPMWSLPLEMQMYVALPFIFMLLGTGNSTRKFIWLYLLSVLAASVLPGISARFSVATFVPCFMAGVLAYLLQQRVHMRIPGYLWPASLVTVILAYVLFEELTPGIHHNLLQWLICLGVGLMIPVFRQLSVTWINRVAHQIAKYSYGIYLFHVVAIWFGCYKLDLPMPLQWVISVIVMVALSVLCYHVLEHPAIRFGAQLARKYTSMTDKRRWAS